VRDHRLGLKVQKPHDHRVLAPVATPGLPADTAATSARGRDTGENHGINNPLLSPYPGGLLVGLVDGSVPFMTEDTDLALVLRFAIRNGGQLSRDTD